MWQVLPHLARQVGQAIRAAGGGTKGFDKVRKAHPKWFKKTPPSKSTKLDNRTGKPVSGSGAKKSEPKAASTSSRGKAGFTEAQLGKYREMYKNRNKSRAWGNLSQSIKDKLLKK